MRVIQASVHRSGRVRCWYQLETGERVYATLEDQAMTDGLLELFGEAVERRLRAATRSPGHGAISGRREAGAPLSRPQAQP